MKDYEIIEKENEKYLKVFKEYLMEKGLKEDTVNNHIWHVDFYINHFLMIGIPKRMKEGCGYDAVNFIESYVNERVIPASKNNVGKFSSSILKFYKCMLEKDFVEKDAYNDLKWCLKECKDEMIDDYYEKNPEPVDLNKVIDSIEAAGDIEDYYLNKYSGEILAILQDEALMDEDYKDEVYAKLDRFDTWVKIPGQYELHEYDIMESFAQSLENEETKYKLLYVLNGKKPFRRFKDEINYYGIANSYYAYRRFKIRNLAIKWLKSEQIEYFEK